MSSSDVLPIFSTRLPSGLRLVIEPLRHVRSVAAGVWLTRGSRHEPDHLVGVSHFLEHLVFKGTSRRPAKAIARTIDTLGGQLDAFTCREQACFYAKVLDEHLPEALDLLSDILSDPLLAPEDIERERGVVLEEINLVNDTPSDGIFDLLYETFFEGHPLGRPVLGSPATVSGLKRDDIVSWRSSNLLSDNLVVTVSGSCSPEELVQLVSHAFTFPAGKTSPATASPEPAGRKVRVKEKASEQVHLCLGFPAVNESSPKRFTASILSTILGGGVASRLFQRIREEEGLAYVIHSFLDTFSDTGIMGIYAGVAPKSVAKALDLMGQELDSIVSKGAEPEELAMAKDQLKGQMMLALEDTANRMGRLALQTITFDRTFSQEETLARIEAVTLDDVQILASSLFSPSNYSLALIGPTSADKLENLWLKG